jgi:hypothetical protein
LPYRNQDTRRLAGFQDHDDLIRVGSPEIAIDEVITTRGRLDDRCLPVLRASSDPVIVLPGDVLEDGFADRMQLTVRVEESVDPILQTPRPPLAHRRRRHVQSFRDAGRGSSLCTREDDAGAARDVGRAARSVSERIQSPSFVGSQHQKGPRTSCAHARLLIYGAIRPGRHSYFTYF